MINEGKLAGKLLVVEDVKAYGKTGQFKKRTIVIEQNPGSLDPYAENPIAVEFLEGFERVDSLAIGDVIEVSYKLAGRSWMKPETSEMKFFVNVQVEGVKVLEKTTTPAAPAEPVDIPF